MCRKSPARQTAADAARAGRPGKLAGLPAHPQMMTAHADPVAAATAERNDFIRQIVREDLAAGRHAAIRTRFPPEPNGYLHIGHAKAICLDFGIEIGRAHV